MFCTNKEIIVFDFDGVIVESNQIKYDAFFEVWNGDVSNNIIQDSLSLGGDRFKVIERVYSSTDVFRNSDSGPKSFVDAYSKIVHNKIIKVGVSKKVTDFLTKNDKTLFINSATPQGELINLCKDLKIDKYFFGIFGSPKSKEDNFNIILEKNNIKAEQMAFFGDMQSDKDVADFMNIEFYPILSKESDLQ